MASIIARLLVDLRNSFTRYTTSGSPEFGDSLAQESPRWAICNQKPLAKRSSQRCQPLIDPLISSEKTICGAKFRLAAILYSSLFSINPEDKANSLSCSHLILSLSLGQWIGLRDVAFGGSWHLDTSPEMKQNLAAS